MISLPPGLRCCNPLNIRKTPHLWPGEIAGDGDFKTFASMEIGVREAARQLLEYVPELAARGKHACVATIVARWAPPEENDTIAYATDVRKRMGVSLTQTLDLRNPATMASLIRAMARHENGIAADTVLTPDIVARGVAAALA